MRLLSLPDALPAADPERRAEIIQLLVAREECNCTEMIGLEWTPPAAPFLRRVWS